MKVRYQADADLNQNIVRALARREPGVDFRTANLAGLEALGDPDVLRLAARENRILVTHDRRTMPRHFSEFIIIGDSPGVIIAPQSLPLARVVDDLLIIWSATEAEDWKNRIFFLPL